MRVISGKLKGKKILLPKDNLTRPLRDLVKESIFNLLEHSNKLKYINYKCKRIRFILWLRIIWIRNYFKRC